ncbi:hypothetical protein [Spirosoma jeollabukense]
MKKSVCFLLWAVMSAAVGAYWLGKSVDWVELDNPLIGTDFKSSLSKNPITQEPLFVSKRPKVSKFWRV